MRQLLKVLIDSNMSAGNSYADASRDESKNSSVLTISQLFYVLEEERKVPSSSLFSYHLLQSITINVTFFAKYLDKLALHH